MNICVIPARGGSKRIPRKNIKIFNGKPLIAYSIEAALASGCFDKVIVSTEDKEIADVAQSLGAEVPFMRPAELADDYAVTIPVINHAIEWCEQHNIHPNYVCCIYATAPLIQVKAIQEAFQIIQANDIDYCFTVTSFPFPIQRAVKIIKGNRLEMFQPKEFNTRSQDLEEAYQDAGQFYWGTADAFKSGRPFFSDLAIPYILPRHLVQDIDTQEDWARAELMYRVLQQENTYI
jgi:N-acylneuraminate cytidylyltransferase